MKKIFYYLGNIASIILAFVAYSFLQNFYFFPKQMAKALNISTQILLILTILMTLLVLALILWLYRRQLKVKNDWQFNQKPHWDLHRFLLALGGALLALVWAVVMQQLLSTRAQQTSANQADLNQIARQAGNSFLPMVCVIAPICEETIFRGFFFNTFFTEKTQVNKWLGIITSGFLFAYMHDPHISRFIWVYWGLGCILAWVYINTKDLRYSILTHILYNSTPYLITLFLLIK